MKEPSLARTTSTLLDGLFDVDNQRVWQDFDRRYRPILQAVARRLGLDAEEAEDVAQETLLQFVRDYRRGKYDRGKGRLRFWIHGILRHRVVDSQRRKSDERGARGESILQHLEQKDQLEEYWDQECRNKILDDALNLMVSTTDLQATTVEAFRRYALEEQPAQEVADALGLSVRTVYLAKHRCARKLKEIVEELLTAFQDDH
jgi:RNA polymerase sigma factor (sigma-70 family)